MSIILVKSLIALTGTLAFGMVIRFRRQVLSLPESVANQLLIAVLILCRLVPFVAVYFLLGLDPRSDVPVFYDAASHALQGEVVYRDFWSPYSPLFAYVTALPLAIWHSAKCVVLFMIIMESAAWWLTYRFYRSRQGSVAQLWALLYLFLPGPFIFCVLGGQEDIWMWLFGTMSLWLSTRSPSEFRLGLLMAMMLIITKALAVLIVIALLFWVSRPVHYVAGLLIVGLPALILLYVLTGDGVLTPLMFSNMPFAPNLPTVLAPLTGDFRPYAGMVSVAGLLAVLGLSAYAGWQLRRGKASYERALPILWVVCYGFMMFIHKSSIGNYLFIYNLPLMTLIPNWNSVRQVSPLLVLNALAPVQPSVWWRIKEPIYSDPAMLANKSYLSEYLMEVCIVGCVGYFVWLAYRQIKEVSVPLNTRFEPKSVSHL